MGRLVSGINGPIIGKVGTVIGSTWKGKPYVKSINGKGPKATTVQVFHDHLDVDRVYGVCATEVKTG